MRYLLRNVRNRCRGRSMGWTSASSILGNRSIAVPGSMGIRIRNLLCRGRIPFCMGIPSRGDIPCCMGIPCRRIPCGMGDCGPIWFRTRNQSGGCTGRQLPPRKVPKRPERSATISNDYYYAFESDTSATEDLAGSYHFKCF